MAKDEGGEGLIDDTAYFRSEAEKRPIVEALRSSERYRELHERLRVARDKVRDIDEDLAREIGLVEHWLENFVIGVAGQMLAEARASELGPEFDVSEDLMTDIDTAPVARGKKGEGDGK